MPSVSLAFFKVLGKPSSSPAHPFCPQADIILAVSWMEMQSPLSIRVGPLDGSLHYPLSLA
jgi:hypothetical protein